MGTFIIAVVVDPINKNIFWNLMQFGKQSWNLLGFISKGNDDAEERCFKGRVISFFVSFASVAEQLESIDALQQDCDENCHYI
jgi:hypothetical protein